MLAPAPVLSQATAADPGAKSLSEKILAMERGLEREFESYFDRDLAEVTQPPQEIARTLSRLSQETESKSAVLWAIPRADHLHLVLIVPNGEPVVIDLYNVPPARLQAVASEFHREVVNFHSPMDLTAAQQLHEWIIEPFEGELQGEGIETLLVCLGDGIRGLPLAALHDGQQFLIEKYSLARIPAFNLIATDYDRLQTNEFLATGASEFREQVSLPAVPVELSAIVDELRDVGTAWPGVLVNETFTLANFADSIEANRLDIVHLATHAEFKPGSPQNSYIQFWDEKLDLAEIGDLDWGRSPVELLVLSACTTAVGDRNAELGFAGLTLQSGVKTAIASLWYVSDAGTLALMSEFYQQLGVAPTKAAALRQAQLRLMRGEAEIRLGPEPLLLSRDTAALPETPRRFSTATDFSHPFYWASFTTIGSPW